MVFRARAVTEMARKKRMTDSVVVELRTIPKGVRGSYLSSEVESWCFLNPGFAVILGGPGAREPMEELAKYVVKKKMVARDAQHPCAIAATVNAVQCIKGIKEGVKALQEFTREVVKGKGIGEQVGKVASLGLGLQSKNCRKEKNFFCFGGYGVAEERVLVVRLVGPGSFDHAVCVDLWRGLIYDGDSSFPLRLTTDALRLCAGGGPGARIAEVREVVEGRKKKRSD